MLDFVRIDLRNKQGTTEIVPKFIMKKTKDLMVRGGDFYAVWVEDRGVWSTEEQDAIDMIDSEIREQYEKLKAGGLERIHPLYLWDADTGSIDRWHKYVQKQRRDDYVMLDEKLIFANTEVQKEDYASKRLTYSLEEGDYSAWDKLLSVLYSEEERHKIEWAIGSIVSGDSRHIQKFMVLYGAAGTGKSTVLNVIQKLFDGYYSVFDAKALGSANASFALEPFKKNPLVAIQHDGDLSKIEDNTRLNSLVSHETMTVNEKFKSTYENSFKCFLFMGTNRPVKITDARSGLLRRLIDVTPTGKKIPNREYNSLIKQIDYQLGAIAQHCLDVYLGNPKYYDSYIPKGMMSASNDFYNFVMDSYYIFKKEDGTTLKSAWEMYKTYCDSAKVTFPYPLRTFKEELKTYFWDYKEELNENTQRIAVKYSRFRSEKFEDVMDILDEKKNESTTADTWLKFEETESIFDKEMADCPAQYANSEGTPAKAWDDATTTLKDIDTSELHYVRVPENHIVIDFDIKDKDGNKSFEKNLEEASKFPPTYAELSKSGGGIHLHYIYSGDVSKLSRVFDNEIEVKIFNGKSSLRRKLTKCVALAIATISSGLPLKGDKKMINFDSVKDEKHLRVMIKKNLNKEIHSSTKCSMDFIKKLLDDAYNSGMHYDVTDLRSRIISFAASSTHQSNNCLKIVKEIHWHSDEPSEVIPDRDEAPIVFYDCEVFPNLFLVNWKVQGEGKPVVRMINPKPEEIENLVRYKLIGFNNRRYDNHMLYACMMGYSNMQLYKLSQRIVSGDRDAFFGEAYNLSYTDIYDFSSAANKKSLKKWEIELGIHHQELGLPWDQPVPEEMWTKVAEYCDNDVISTEAVFNHLQGDWTARRILADVAGMTYNDTTNSLTTRIIFGKERHPQSSFNWRDLGQPVQEVEFDTLNFIKDHNLYPIPFDDKSVLPWFPGYVYENGHNIYRGEDVGKGGYVYSEPGMYIDAALLDITSMHPSSTIDEVLFGPVFTNRFREVKESRVYIKHEDYEKAKAVLEGKLAPYLKDGEYSPKDLANALKTGINSVYGLTSASFDNAFRDIRNKNNIVALRGALFMVDLKHAVQEKGFTVAHIKTDSIKIPNATPEIIQFVMDFGKRYGYNFEHEATYKRMCLVNKSTYIAQFATEEWCKAKYGYSPEENSKEGGEWTATGEQFAVPYVFKTLFSKEPIEFKDMCETFQVQTALYLDMNEPLAEGHDYQFVGRIGSFCPILPGNGGGLLVRESKDKDGNVKYDSANGAKGYRWLEAENIESLGMDAPIDKGYYRKLVDDAVAEISKYGDFYEFVSDVPGDFMNRSEN